MQTKEDQINRRCYIKSSVVPHVRDLMNAHMGKAAGRAEERLAREYRDWLAGI